jgi:hypothetical protein
VNVNSSLSGNYGYIGGGIVVSIVLSFLFVFLLKTYPGQMVYTMIIASLAVILSFAIAGAAIGNVGLCVGMIISLVIYGSILCCFRKQIKIGILLVKVATKFLT